MNNYLIMNKIFKLVTVAALCLAVNCIVTDNIMGQNKKDFTLKQIAHGLFPKGVIKPAADWMFDKTAAVDNETQQADKEGDMIKRAATLLKCGKKSLMNPTLSPDGAALAFTYQNDLYVYNSQIDKIVRLTEDGSEVILNGYASWVYYEEILGRSSNYKAFWWSPDSKTIAFYRFDDSEVPMFPIYDPASAKEQIRRTHYPMAGEKNPEVKVGFVKADGGSIVWGDFDCKVDQYFGIPFWNSESSKFIVPWMPRVQQDLVFYAVDPLNGGKSDVYKEHQDSWIDWPEQMVFVEDGFYMVRDFTMWEQIYFNSFDGKVRKTVTSGKNWDIKMLKIDKKKGEMYFTAKREISTRVDIYKVSLKSGKITRLSEGEFSYSVLWISDDFKTITAIRSNAVTPFQRVEIYTEGKRALKVMADSKGENFDSYNIAMPKMLTITTPDGYTIPAKMTLPIHFDDSKKYPVIVHMYGGPNTPQVADVWSNPSRNNQWWAYQDVIQITIDHRGSGHCGKEGLNFMYRNFFSIELKDFIEWAKYLQSLPYVDKDKIGIYGFSYGGSMTTLCVTEGCEYFKYGIAGGGVYDYMLYDSHYTERFMDTPQRNPEGYKRTIMADRVAASGYKGDASNFLLLTHGAADDNVHIQNTMSLVKELQLKGIQFDLMIYPGQLHGYRGAQGRFSAIQDYRFWYRHLLGKEVVPQELTDALANKRSK